MSMQPALPEAVHVKYGAVAVFALPEFNAAVIEELHPGDPFRVSRQQGLFYAVTLGDGREGFVFARNLAGDGLPASDHRPADGAQDARRSEAARRSWGNRLHQWAWRLSRR
jgi:hypothetical protein